MNPYDKINQNFQIGINQALRDVGAPELSFGLAFQRSQDFINLSTWLKGASDQQLKTLAKAYGFLPVLYASSGIDLLSARLLAKQKTLDISSYGHYLRFTLANNGKDLQQQAFNFGKTLFKHDFTDDDFVPSKDYAHEFVTDFFEFTFSFAENTPYVEILARYLALLDTKVEVRDVDLTNSDGEFDESITDDAHEVEDVPDSEAELPDDVKDDDYDTEIEDREEHAEQLLNQLLSGKNQ